MAIRPRQNKQRVQEFLQAFREGKIVFRQIRDGMITWDFKKPPSTDKNKEEENSRILNQK